MIEINELTKRYGDKLAVDGLTFTVEAGTVTGFLGPNGAGKSTTMRMIAGLDAPTSGAVAVNGKRYADSRAPMAELGVLLEAGALHPGRSARNHLRAVAQTAGIGSRRVDEVLEFVGLADAASKRVGGFSLGMTQRLGIATALLGRPQTVVLDEPVNGLDPDGVRWIRDLLRQLADEGRTVFVSSHLMSEMAQTATRLVVIGRGRLIADCTVAEFVARSTTTEVELRSPEAVRLAALLRERQATVLHERSDVLHVRGLSSDDVGRIAWQARVPIFQLNVVAPSLEDAFMNATRESIEFGSQEAV
jgi:ABC-2 type transport system ATP-binding protein